MKTVCRICIAKGVIALSLFLAGCTSGDGGQVVSETGGDGPRLFLLSIFYPCLEVPQFFGHENAVTPLVG